MAQNPAQSQRGGILRLLAWILASAVAGGGIGWAVAQAAAPQAETIAIVLGAAGAGGLGAVVRLFVFGDSEPAEPESMTVRTETDDSGPEPQPADLFADHPDPIVYYDNAGEGPVVRAVNDAFEKTFGVTAEAVEDAALGDTLMVTDRTEDVVAAAASGDAFDAVLSCETGEETVPFRLRLASVGDAAGTRGYVLYTPVERK